MSSSDDDLPDVGGPGLVDTTKVPRLKIDVDFEIKQSLLRKEKQLKITVEQKKLETRVPDEVVKHEIKTPKITPFPESRAIFCLDQSQRCFNTESLSLKDSFPDDCLVLASNNWVEFFQWVRIRVENLSDQPKRSALVCLWFMQSVNPDQHIIFKCHDLLLELNNTWRLKWEEVIVLFWNWGARVSDFVTGKDIENIYSPLQGGELVTPYNIECTLNILKEQLTIGSLDGEEEFQKTTFILLCLLSLDMKYCSSLYAIQSCLEAFETFLHKSSWVVDYCEGLLKVEHNHARIAYLAQCILPSSVRRCLSFGFCRTMLSLPPKFDEKPEPIELRDLLQKHQKVMMGWESYEIHSFMTLVDCIVADNITVDTEKEIRSDFLVWLRDFSQGLRFISRDDVDVDATVVSELLIRLQTEWEGSWSDICECEDYFNDIIDCEVYSEDSDMN